MSRGLVLLIVAGAAASAQADSVCYSTLQEAFFAWTETAWDACHLQYTAPDIDLATRGYCSVWSKSYDVAKCDPLWANYSKCGLKAAKLLKADNTFDDAAFKATMLQNECSADAKFIAAYPTCKNSTMKYLNFGRLNVCLQKALY
ncbi:uncharacterized protein LOC108679929 [Hyalella azteca]|uniref:Uncharacterized protein LOC108679929 n=1 Tax=Hyalella azteca TaxID=294128 RepID=A0A8B7PFS3_HYAAZ|nr:uncharacterized protein LOC108679929 [Hyalella azteca]